MTAARLALVLQYAWAHQGTGLALRVYCELAAERVKAA